MAWRRKGDKPLSEPMLSRSETTISIIVSDPINWSIQYILRNMHTVFALLCFVVVIHWLIFPYPSGLLHWHCGNLTIAPVPAKQPWWIWINTSCEFIMNDCITTTKQSTTKPCAYFLGYTVCVAQMSQHQIWPITTTEPSVEKTIRTKKTHHTSPSRASYELWVVIIFLNVDHG